MDEIQFVTWFVTIIEYTKNIARMFHPSLLLFGEFLNKFTEDKSLSLFDLVRCLSTTILGVTDFRVSHVDESLSVLYPSFFQWS